ncbi:MAG: hypothetical protein FWG42_01675 [Clostridiales bacterium]|nr:hypothetical protein [Clostridiales bacterium]
MIPKDESLDIANTSFTPGVRRVASWLSACDSFERSSATLEEACGIYVCAKDMERIAEAAGAAIEAEKAMQIEEAFSTTEKTQTGERPVPVMYIEYDGTGIPVVKRESSGRQGKQEDGTAKTRESKLGCIFTQTKTRKVKEKTYPVRDEHSTSYFGAIETSELFGRRLYMEAVRRGVNLAEKVVIIGDGAKWIWNQAQEHFPEAIQIADLYHAKEHLWEFIREAVSEADEQAEVKNKWYRLLDNGNIKELSDEMAHYVTGDDDKQNELQRGINYFIENRERMKYADFKKRASLSVAALSKRAART